MKPQSRQGHRLRDTTLVPPPAAALLPKPARVEPWQRWRWCGQDNLGAVVVVASQHHPGQWRILAEGPWDGGTLLGVAALDDTGLWKFLGYAKPKRVEVGQRWCRSGLRSSAAGDCDSEAFG